MAEPTCLVLPFSYTSHEENSNLYGIEESISFGRFMSDNLEWEKWSSFNNNKNRHVEEAEKYSRPGSVAQKKAYFEAHFKRMAALKAAALLDQANSAENSNEGERIDSTTHDVQNLIADEKVENVEKGCEAEDVQGFVVHQNDLYSVVTENETSPILCENVDLTELVDSIIQTDLYPVSIKDETCNESKDNQSSSEIVQRNIPPLQQKRSSLIEEPLEPIIKKNPPLSSYMSPAVGGTARTSLLSECSTNSSEGLIYPGKENYATPINKKTNATDQDKKKTPLRLSSINREFNRIMSPVIRKIGTSSKAFKEYSTPLKTPVKATNPAGKSPRMTPSRGARSRLESSAGDNKASGSRWQLFSSDASMSPSTGRHRISSPIIPNSFCMNGDRGSRRKQKLEEKFNATASERPPQSSKFKEKAGAELNKFRQSFCFKAMSSPDHYGENEALRSPKQKDGTSQRKSPKRGKQPVKTTTKIPLPPRRPLIKQSGSKNVQQSLLTK